VFFPLKFKCTVERKTTTTNPKSGQQNITWVVVNDSMDCLFLETSGNKKANAPMERFQGVIAFYADPDADLQEGDKIIDTKDRFGIVVEPGPYQVVSVKKVVDFNNGRVHHLSCKLTGLSHAGDN